MYKSVNDRAKEKRTLGDNQSMALRKRTDIKEREAAGSGLA